MSGEIEAVRAALETAVAAISPPIQTAWENRPFTPPAPNVPYQEVDVLPADPINNETGSRFVERGLLQIRLCWPQGGVAGFAGAGLAGARAQLVRNAFYRGRSLTPVSGVTVTIDFTPRIEPGFNDGDRWVVVCRVSYYAHINA